MSCEEWLQKHGFDCAALSARISPAACASYRQGRKDLHAKSFVVPLACQQCPHPAQSAPIPERQVKRKLKTEVELAPAIDPGPKILRPRGPQRQRSEGRLEPPAVDHPAAVSSQASIRSTRPPKSQDKKPRPGPVLGAEAKEFERLLAQSARRGNRACAALLERLKEGRTV